MLGVGRRHADKWSHSAGYHGGVHGRQRRHRERPRGRCSFWCEPRRSSCCIKRAGCDFPAAGRSGALGDLHKAPALSFGCGPRSALEIQSCIRVHAFGARVASVDSRRQGLKLAARGSCPRSQFLTCMNLDRAPPRGSRTSKRQDSVCAVSNCCLNLCTDGIAALCLYLSLPRRLLRQDRQRSRPSVGQFVGLARL